MSKKKISEFRINNSKKSNGHPAYVFGEKGDSYIYIGLTHSPKTYKVKNYKLSRNPNPKDSKDSYVRPFATLDKKSKFSKPKKTWSLSKKDKKLMNKIKKKIK